MLEHAIRTGLESMVGAQRIKETLSRPLGRSVTRGARHYLGCTTASVEEHTAMRWERKHGAAFDLHDAHAGTPRPFLGAAAPTGNGVSSRLLLSETHETSKTRSHPLVTVFEGRRIHHHRHHRPPPPPAILLRDGASLIINKNRRGISEAEIASTAYLSSVTSTGAVVRGAARGCSRQRTEGVVEYG